MEIFNVCVVEAKCLFDGMAQREKIFLNTEFLIKYCYEKVRTRLYNCKNVFKNINKKFKIIFVV